jgi:acetyltransferase-like isoleucine patch superfamily enzyme
MKKLLFILAFQLFTMMLFAQGKISGAVSDSLDNSPLVGVNLILRHQQDSAYLRGTVTDVNGQFAFQNIKPGKYSLRVTYVGYSVFETTLTLDQSDVVVGSLKISQSATTLKALVVTGQSIPIEQKGDTVQYNASGYKVNRDATAEDLIAKMPGMTTDETGVKAQGEQVRQVLVDGKRFFGDDATTALKNLPAEIIEKIEVFDRMSDQSQFTGFDDGQGQRTLNIVTKKGMNNGQFGKVTAGLSDNGRYIAGGNLNSFKGDRKITVLGLTNNINQQNFSSEDLLGITGGTQPGRSGGGRGGNNTGGNNNFLVGQQKGISTTHAGGLNYINEFSTKAEMSGSYFFNTADNDRRSNLSRTYIARDSGLLYTEHNRSLSSNTNHRVNVRFEYNIDSANSLVITPRLSLQLNNANANSESLSTIAETLRNNINKTNKGDYSGYTFGGNLLYRHRFKKRGRSISWGVDFDKNGREGNTELYSVNENFERDRTTIIDQCADDFSNSERYSSNIAFTEPVGKFGQVQMNYTVSLTKSESDKKTYDVTDEEAGETSTLNTRLTNVFQNNYLSNRGGVSYRYNKMRKLNIMAGLNFQEARLASDQDFPKVFEVERSFYNFLPQASMNYRFSNGNNVRVQYRTSTNAPSISQLQNVVNNSNPLFLRSGNAALEQDYQQNLTIRINKTDAEKGRTFLFFVYGAYVQDYIGNAAYLNSDEDTVVVNNIELAPGQQLTYPVNVTENWNARTFVTYGLPLKFVKSNINFNTGFNYNRTPAVINGDVNLSHNYTISQGLVIGSNISKNFDFTISYTGNYTIVNNSVAVQQGGGNNYFTHLSSIRVNVEPWKGLVLTSNLTNSIFSGLSADLDQNILFWNAAVGYKLLKDKSLETKLSVFDLLNQNKSIGRDVTETFIEDSITNVLTRYFMLSLTYTFRKF